MTLHGYQTEALGWLSNPSKKNRLAVNMFNTRKDAIDAVKRLYAAGAVRVDVEVIRDDPGYIGKYGGEYSDTVVVYGTLKSRDKLKEVIKNLEPEGYGTIWDLEGWDGQEAHLRWD